MVTDGHDGKKGRENSSIMKIRHPRPWVTRKEDIAYEMHAGEGCGERCEGQLRGQHKSASIRQ